jgi:hypothetical protein
MISQALLGNLVCISSTPQVMCEPSQAQGNSVLLGELGVAEQEQSVRRTVGAGVVLECPICMMGKLLWQLFVAIPRLPVAESRNFAQQNDQ